MGRKTTIIDIANKLGITPSAVSKALSNHPRISLKTKNAVHQVVKDLNYQPNSLATGLRKGKSGLIGVLVPGIHFSFFASAIKGIEETLSKRGYAIIISQSQDNPAIEKMQLEVFSKARVEGVIASLALETTNLDPYREFLKHTPLVLFDRTVDELDISKVSINDQLGAEMAVTHLIEMGYKRIAHIGGNKNILPFNDRMIGYMKTLEKYGFPVEQAYIHLSDLSKNAGEEITDKLMSLENPPDAIFSSSDYPILGALKVLSPMGYKVPEEFGLVGFSNEEYTSLVTPSITTVNQFSEDMGVTAAEFILRQLSEINPLLAKKQIDRIIPKLEIRQSSKRRLLE